MTSPLREQGVARLWSTDRNFDPRLTAGASNGCPVTDAVPGGHVFCWRKAAFVEYNLGVFIAGQNAPARFLGDTLAASCRLKLERRRSVDGYGRSAADSGRLLFWLP